jgi:uncharacterized membrane protein
MTLRPLRIAQGALLALPNTVLPVIGQVPHMTWAGLAVFSIAVYRPSIRATDWPYFLFAFGVVANAALGVAITGVFPDSLLTNNGFVGGLLLIAAYLTARTLTDTVWKAVLAFIAVEAAAIYVQLALGLRFFFPDQQMITAGSEFKFVREIGGESLWYLIRPQGLSISSTIAGAKMLLGILIAYMVPFPRRLRWTIIAFLLGALLLNFKRSGILSVGVLGVIVFTLDVADSGWQKRHTILSTATVLTALFALGAIIAQLTRETVETLSGISMDLLLNQLSGRTEIWQETWKFIRDNLFFGNFSRRYTVTSGGYAHSSLLTLVATHGLFLALVMVWFYLKRLWRKPLTLILLVPLLFDTLFQEHIFWYISMFDIFVLYLLTTRTPSRYWLTPWPENNEMENSRRTLAARAGT